MFPNVSSSDGSDGTILNSGVRSGIWARLNQMRQLQENGKDVLLLKIWCAVHRGALASIRTILMYLKTSPDADANEELVEKRQIASELFFDGCCPVILKIPNAVSKRKRFSI